jgi:polyisoprenoid-binding protein YceI
MTTEMATGTVADVGTDRATQTWRIDPAHTTVQFAVKHLMISTVRGQFGGVDGTVQVADDDPTTAQISVSIGTESVDTRDAKRDAHLRSADFFDVENHPAMTFTSRRITADGDALTIVGDLTIRGTTREVTLAATREGHGRDPWGNERVGYTATTKVNRRDFGLVWNMALETGGVLVGDDVKISIETELVKQA